MRRKQLLLLCLAALLLVQHLTAQENLQNNNTFRRQLGLKAGSNFFSLNSIKSVDQATNNKTGFFAGGYLSFPAKRLGFRTEAIFSRQGYSYKSGARTGEVMLDYLVLPQLTTLNITKFLQLQAGGQIAILLNTDVDSTESPSSMPSLETGKNYFSKINYGFAAGIEVKPLGGLFIGGRYNLFFNLLGNESPSTYPDYVPKYDGNLKNGLLQFYLGYQF